MIYDVIVIGSGPAGISASLYTKRANLETLIISKGIGTLENTKLLWITNKQKWRGTTKNWRRTNKKYRSRNKERGSSSNRL